MLEEKYKVSTKIYNIDFAKADTKAFDGLAETINGLDISVLVNNVGRSHEMPVYFHETERQEIDDILQINIHSTLRVTQIVLPTLLARYVALTRLTRCVSNPNHQFFDFQEEGTDP